MDTFVECRRNESRIERQVNWDARINIGSVNRIKFYTDMIGIEETSRTICRTVARMVMVMWKSNQAYCHQAIGNAHRNYPASWINVDSIALQELLPLSVSLNHATIIHLATSYVKHLFGAIGSFNPPMLLSESRINTD